MSFVARRCVGRAWSVLVGTSLALAGLSCVPEVIGAPPEVGAVVVAGAPERLYVGSEVVLSTTITDTRGLTLTQEPVTWSSSNASIAAVDAQGRVRGIGAGTVTITATAGGKGTPVPLTVLERVASVAVTATRPSVVAGDSVQLTANPRDVAGTALTGRAVTWASNDTLIATVSSAGLVTTKAYFGPATRPVSITATSEGQSGTLNLSVAPVPVGAVVVSSDSATIEPTANQRLNATVRSASGESLTGRSITWSTTDTSVAVVSDSGLVTARAYLGGTTRSSRIIVTSEGKADTAVVVVTPLAVSTVSLQGAPADSVLLLGGSVSLLPQLKSGAGQTVTDRQVTWVSSAPAVATVSVSGVVTPVNAGTAVITASSEGKSASATLLVRAPLAVPAPSASSPLTTTVLDGAVSLTVPPRATSVSVLTVAPAPDATSDDRALRGATYTFGPAGTSFAVPVTLSLRFDPSAIPQAKRSGLRLALVTGSGLQEVPGGTVDSGSSIVSANVSHFSAYTIFVPADPSRIELISGGGQEGLVGATVPLPVVIRVVDVQGRPVSREKVRFEVASGGGALSDTTSVETDSVGLATVRGSWTLGPSIGVQSLTGRTANGTSVTVAATARMARQVLLSGKENLYGYGMWTPAPSGHGGGILAPTIPLDRSYGDTMQFVASLVAGQHGPDGLAGPTMMEALGPIGAYQGPKALFLAGVFLPQGDIEALAAPAPSVYAATADYERLVYAPALRQPFFVGDGRTSTGVKQKFVIPPGAARLVLGIIDGPFFSGQPGYYEDNEFSFGVSIEGPVAAPVAALELLPPTVSVTYGASASLGISLQDSLSRELSGRTVRFTVSDTALLSVAPTGVVSVRKQLDNVTRLAVVYAFAEGEIDSTLVTMTPIPVSDVVLVRSSMQVEIGTAELLRVVAVSSSGDTLQGRTPLWSSGSVDYASVTAAGVFSPLRLGSATINVSVDSVSRVFPFEIVSPVGSYLKFSGGQTRVALSARAYPDAMSFTMEAWVRGDTLSQGAIWSSADNWGHRVVFAFDESQFLYMLIEDSGRRSYLRTTERVDLSEWTHVAWVLGSCTQSLFVNGRRVATTCGDAYRARFPEVGGSPYGWGDLAKDFNGELGAFRVSTGSRFGDQGFVPSRLALDASTVLLFPFREGQGQYVDDIKSGVRGTISGGVWKP